MTRKLYPFRETEQGTFHCQACGEHIDPAADEFGEFQLPEGQTDPSGRTTVVCHAQCGFDRGLKLA